MAAHSSRTDSFQGLIQGIDELHRLIKQNRETFQQTIKNALQKLERVQESTDFAQQQFLLSDGVFVIKEETKPVPASTHKSDTKKGGGDSKEEKKIAPQYTIKQEEEEKEAREVARAIAAVEEAISREKAKSLAESRQAKERDEKIKREQAELAATVAAAAANTRLEEQKRSREREELESKAKREEMIAWQLGLTAADEEEMKIKTERTAQRMEADRARIEDEKRVGPEFRRAEERQRMEAERARVAEEEKEKEERVRQELRRSEERQKMESERARTEQIKTEGKSGSEAKDVLPHTEFLLPDSMTELKDDLVLPITTRDRVPIARLRELPPNVMHVTTWNVLYWPDRYIVAQNENKGRQVLFQQNLLTLLQYSDVVCLQELDARWAARYFSDSTPLEGGDFTYYKSVFGDNRLHCFLGCKRGADGSGAADRVAMIWRSDILQAIGYRKIILGATYSPTDKTGLQIQFVHRATRRGVRILTAHLNGSNSEKRLVELTQCVEACKLNAVPGALQILCGDFNFDPYDREAKLLKDLFFSTVYADLENLDKGSTIRAHPYAMSSYDNMSTAPRVRVVDHIYFYKRGTNTKPVKYRFYQIQEGGVPNFFGEKVANLPDATWCSDHVPIVSQVVFDV